MYISECNKILPCSHTALGEHNVVAGTVQCDADVLNRFLACTYENAIDAYIPLTVLSIGINPPSPFFLSLPK